MNQAKQSIVYAFIDSQNLNLGVRSQGWQIDYQKLRLYLKNKYNVTKAFLFIGLVVGNERLYEQLQNAGFILIFKPTVRYIQDGRDTVKGNVDAELVLHAAAIEYANYDQALIVSGDGDFRCLIEFLIAHNKLARIMTPNRNYSRLLHQFTTYIVSVDRLRERLEYTTKNQLTRSVETLGGAGETSRSSGRSKP